MKIYAITMKAHRSGILNIHIGATTKAQNKYEAVGIGIEMCKGECPPEGGWNGHEAIVLDISAWLEEHGVVITPQTAD